MQRVCSKTPAAGAGLAARRGTLRCSCRFSPAPSFQSYRNTLFSLRFWIADGRRRNSEITAAKQRNNSGNSSLSPVSIDI
jgi:hypothetical protein